MNLSTFQCLYFLSVTWLKEFNQYFYFYLFLHKYLYFDYFSHLCTIHSTVYILVMYLFVFHFSIKFLFYYKKKRDQKENWKICVIWPETSALELYLYRSQMLRLNHVTIELSTHLWHSLAWRTKSWLFLALTVSSCSVGLKMSSSRWQWRVLWTHTAKFVSVSTDHYEMVLSPNVFIHYTQQNSNKLTMIQARKGLPM